MTQVKQNSSPLLAIPNLLTLIFIVMKLTESGAVADWSWWWVLSPVWITLAVAIVFGLLAILFLGLDRAHAAVTKGVTK